MSAPVTDAACAPEPAGLRSAYCGTLRAADAGRTVTVCGWVATVREHGEHLVFVDVRDHTGIVQCVVDASVDVRSEYVVALSGTVARRPSGSENTDIATGEVELKECSVEVLAAAEPPPVPIGGRRHAEEAARMRHRFLDLRDARMQGNLRLRSAVNAALRGSMAEEGFCEVETPLLWVPTPEGAREFLVPSRLNPGSAYALPQSPQIAKQLLMVAGLDRYFQIARCLRDEDLRADRQFEFTQLDIEASFVGAEEVIGFVSRAVEAACAAAGRAGDVTMERMTWTEAMAAYGTDKPDLRIPLRLHDLSPVLAGTGVRALVAPTVQALVVPGGAQLGRARLDGLVSRAKELGAAGLVWMRVHGDGGATTLDSPVSRHMGESEPGGIVAATGAAPGDLLLVVAGEPALVRAVLGRMRVEVGGSGDGDGGDGGDGGPAGGGAERSLRFVWVTEFPMFEGLDADGRPQAAHHPFTMPHPDDLDLLETDPLAVRSGAYDLVCNGWELGSGSVRIHRADVQARVFAALGLSMEEAHARFGFLLDAFRYGAPPHAGFGMGVDRLVAICAGEENIREVIAFPKTQGGLDLMTGAPAPLAPGQLAELGLRAVRPG